MDLTLLTSKTTNKPWLDLFANSITVNNITSNGISTPGVNQGMILLATGTQLLSLSANTGGGAVAYSQSQNKVILSGANAKLPVSSSNGVTWTSLNTGISPGPVIGYSPSLNLYTCVNGAGTEISTSPTAVDGTWTVRTPFPVNFSADKLQWIPELGRYYCGCSNATSKIASSTDGINWEQQSTDRENRGVAYSPTLKRLVAVGANGTQYSDDGKTWVTTGGTTASMASVTYSPYWKEFVAIPYIASPGRLYRSTNGINWSFSTTPFAANLRSIIWIEDLMVYVICGDNDTFWVSSDGRTVRKIQTPGGTEAFYGSGYIPQWGLYIAGGISDKIRISPKLFV